MTDKIYPTACETALHAGQFLEDHSYSIYIFLHLKCLKIMHTHVFCRSDRNNVFCTQHTCAVLANIYLQPHVKFFTMPSTCLVQWLFWAISRCLNIETYNSKRINQFQTHAVHYNPLSFSSPPTQVMWSVTVVLLILFLSVISHRQSGEVQDLVQSNTSWNQNAKWGGGQ